MKVIAFYLPQFHEIPENNEWWGEGFTEWTNVKKATPLYENHNQPRVPLDDNYYNLLDENTLQWQDHLAQEYGVYGFCFYHYWFDGHLLLQKPVEMYRDNKNLKTHYCICWANEHWTNAWSGGTPKVLIQQKYGGEKEWREHFYYLLPFFNDKRYIKHENRPLLIIYRPEIIDCLPEMLNYLNRLAKHEGFDGIDFAYQHAGYTVSPKCNESLFTYALEYHPNCAQVFMSIEKNGYLEKIKKSLVTFVEDKLHFNLREIKNHDRLKHYDYDVLWKYINQMKPRNDKCVPGAFVDWDNTPRRGKKGFVVDGANPNKFEKYFTKEILKAKNEYKKDMIFIFSWNEWAEGGYLEPDTKNQYGYLEAIKKALVNTGELE